MNSSSVARPDARDVKSSGQGSKHTPAPWATTYRLGKRTMIVAAEARPIAITDVLPLSVGDSVEEEANARLIAAAPDLLEALCGLLAVAEMTTFSDEFPGECEAANAAIARATGETGQ